MRECDEADDDLDDRCGAAFDDDSADNVSRKSKSPQPEPLRFGDGITIEGNAHCHHSQNSYHSELPHRRQGSHSSHSIRAQIGQKTLSRVADDSAIGSDPGGSPVPSATNGTAESVVDEGGMQSSCDILDVDFSEVKSTVKISNYDRKQRMIVILEPRSDMEYNTESNEEESDSDVESDDDDESSSEDYLEAKLRK